MGLNGPRLVFLGFLICALFLLLFVREVGKNLDTSAFSSLGAQLAIKVKVVREIPADCELDTHYPASVRQWCDLIEFYSEKHALEPALVASIVWLESGGDPAAISSSGAVGLMQVMPKDGKAAEFECPNGPCFSNRPESQQLLDPEFNISYGTKLLASMLKQHDDLREALKAYGPMDVGYVYADRVLKIYNRYRLAR